MQKSVRIFPCDKYIFVFRKEGPDDLEKKQVVDMLCDAYPQLNITSKEKWHNSEQTGYLDIRFYLEKKEGKLTIKKCDPSKIVF